MSTRRRVKNNGLVSGQIFRALDNPNDIVFFFEWDSLENVQEFAKSDDLRETMERAGVTGEPEVLFLEKLEDVDV